MPVDPAAEKAVIESRNEMWRFCKTAVKSLLMKVKGNSIEHLAIRKKRVGRNPQYIISVAEGVMKCPDCTVI